MKKASGSFLKINVYRRRFLGTVSTVLVIAVFCLGIAVWFFTTMWVSGQQLKVHDRFVELEQQSRSRNDRLESYANGLYASPSLMEDAKALFESADAQEYMDSRCVNSMSTKAQIAWLPGDMRKLFTDRQLRIRGVVLRSGKEMKAIWQDRISGDMRVSYGLKDEEQLKDIPGFGDTLIGSYDIRNPQFLMNNLGELEFYGNSGDIYPKESAAQVWAVVNGMKIAYCSSGRERDREWLLKARGYGEIQGCFLWRGKLPVFYSDFETGSDHGNYVSVVDLFSLWRANGPALAALAGLVLVLAGGAVLAAFVNMGKEASFLARIMDMLKAMEERDFTQVDHMGIRGGRRPSEYVMISDALINVSSELDGYIKKEYLLKLKQQETAMRALRHQINPHFLYNTLESIRARALVLGDRESAQAIEELGKLYRTMIRYPEVISLHQEAELLELYLKIMSLRFPGSFVWRASVDEEIKNETTVAFWLQPLAENFFNHGIDRESEFNLLLLSAVKKKKGILVTMSDNGRGIMDSRLLEIRNNMVHGGDDLGSDIGLRNVYMRLSYFYGKEFSMKIENQTAGGVKITIFLPEPVGKE